MRNSECCSCFMGFSAEAGKPQLSQLPCYKSATAAAAVAAATAILLLVLLLLLLLSCYWYCYCCCHCDYCCYNDEEVAFPIYCFAMHSAFVEQFIRACRPEPKPIFINVGLGLGARVSVVMLSFDFSDPLCRAARRANLRERGQGHLRQVQERQRASACRAALPAPQVPSTNQHAQKTSLYCQAWIVHSGSNEVCRARSR